MTLVAAVNALAEVTVLADCRLSVTNDQGHLTASHDVCQKFVVVNEWCILGWTGNCVWLKLYLQLLVTV